MTFKSSLFKLAAEMNKSFQTFMLGFFVSIFASICNLSLTLPLLLKLIQPTVEVVCSMLCGTVPHLPALSRGVYL